VIAVEPNPIAARILRRNIERNRLNNFEVIERMIAPAPGRQRLYAGGTLTTWGTHYVADRFVDVDSITLDQLIEPYSRVDLVKLDIEGMEGPALLASKRLARVRALSYACNPDQIQVVQDFLRPLGFSVRPSDHLFRSEENWIAERAAASPFGGGLAVVPGSG
jgi:FkbM family methyltransferase